MAGPGLLDRLAQLLVAQQLAASAGRNLSAGAVLVFSALLVHADYDHGRVRPSVQRLAELTGLTRRNVQHAIGTLLSCGLIQLVDHGAPRARGGRGAIAHYVVAPHAAAGDSVALVTRERASMATPIAEKNGVAGDAVSPGNGVAGDAVTARKGVADGPKGRRWERERASPATHEHSSEHSEHQPPNPPRGAGRPPEDEDEAARCRVKALNRIGMLGRLENEFAVRRAINEFAAAGGTLDELDRLIKASDDGQRTRRDRIGLVTHWLGNVGLWRGVLADLDDRAVAAESPRRAASSMTTPVALRDLATQ